MNTFKAEREIIYNERGAFAVDVWNDGKNYNAHAIQVDSMESKKAFTSDESRGKAINEAIEHVVEFNQRNQ
ncbi:hypothetical protein [Halobacillus sp. A5]|uniref:hypothetical protein n=1 Tax=Halobacillus sp. A5 TaxID=2880263 RepID=UPI0020A61DC7|nr:hypothetical protein [Halobacillus sp. A5]MCP3026895.1 hypothetical protein [Halobacillus sp. A5]